MQAFLCPPEVGREGLLHNPHVRDGIRLTDKWGGGSLVRTRDRMRRIVHRKHISARLSILPYVGGKLIIGGSVQTGLESSRFDLAIEYVVWPHMKRGRIQLFFRAVNDMKHEGLSAPVLLGRNMVRPHDDERRVLDVETTHLVSQLYNVAALCIRIKALVEELNKSSMDQRRTAMKPFALLVHVHETRRDSLDG